MIKNSYTVGNLRIEPALVLSPMSGVTCSAFRRLIKELNPRAVGLMISEFISVEALTRKVPKSLAMMRFAEMERPYGIQIFGYDINRMRDAALMAVDAGADLVDINCGCPAPKVVRKGGGCELMRQPEHLQKIIQTVRAAINIPLTIKIRAGWDENSKNAIDVAKMAEAEGVQALAVHGRTRAQMYRGEACWDLVQAVASQLKIPVLGSGDVIDINSARQRLRSPIAGFYIGRAALFNPYIFTELASGQPVGLLKDPLHVHRILERYIELLLEEFSHNAAIGKVKQLASQLCRGLEWRRTICTAATLVEQQQLLAQLKLQLTANSAVLPIESKTPTVGTCCP